MPKNVEIIEFKAIEPKFATITIQGTTDLVLNKMNDINARALADKQKSKAKNTDTPNMWEAIITSMHWRDGKPTEFTEEGFAEALTHNAPCLTPFGLKKSFGQALVRNEIDKYATKFDASVNVVNKGNLVPIRFTQHFVDEKLMSPKKGSPVLCYLNRFSGWSADIDIQYLDNVYSINQIVDIINRAGFGIGIGSGRSSGYGRYSVVDVK